MKRITAYVPTDSDHWTNDSAEVGKVPTVVENYSRVLRERLEAKYPDFEVCIVQQDQSQPAFVEGVDDDREIVRTVGQIGDGIDWTNDSFWESPKALTDDQIRELCVLTTRDEAGRHFTEWSSHWKALESAGCIKVTRPVHTGTGIDYSQEYWTLEVTPEGQDVVDANPELHPQQ
jgi:hypothetical protein